jgi:protein-S-isoprenylcysteine O-methyltransferase Ste14
MMIASVNFAVLIITSLLFLVFYVRSAGPAALEKRIGPQAYGQCTRYRIISGVLMGIAGASYLIYFSHPLPISVPRTFPWPWWVSVLIALAITIPAGYLWWRGMRDAGEGTMIVKKEHSLFGGIYERIRHPQAAGEMPFWSVISFLLHSPFLVLFSIIWIPIFAMACWVEERDLAIRYGRAYEEYRQRTGFLIPRRR